MIQKMLVVDGIIGRYWPSAVNAAWRRMMDKSLKQTNITSLNILDLSNTWTESFFCKYIQAVKISAQLNWCFLCCIPFAALNFYLVNIHIFDYPESRLFTEVPTSPNNRGSTVHLERWPSNEKSYTCDVNFYSGVHHKLHWSHRCCLKTNISMHLERIQARIQDFEMGVNFCNNV